MYFGDTNVAGSMDLETLPGARRGGGCTAMGEGVGVWTGVEGRPSWGRLLSLHGEPARAHAGEPGPRA